MTTPTLGLLISRKATQGTPVDHFGHSIEVNQQTEEDFVGCGTVFMDTAKVACNGDTRYILPMESQDT